MKVILYPVSVTSLFHLNPSILWNRYTSRTGNNKLRNLERFFKHTTNRSCKPNVATALCGRYYTIFTDQEVANHNITTANCTLEQNTLYVKILKVKYSYFEWLVLWLWFTIHWIYKDSKYAKSLALSAQNIKTLRAL